MPIRRFISPQSLSVTHASPESSQINMIDLHGPRWISNVVILVPWKVSLEGQSFECRHVIRKQYKVIFQVASCSKWSGWRFIPDVTRTLHRKMLSIGSLVFPFCKTHVHTVCCSVGRYRRFFNLNTHVRSLWSFCLAKQKPLCRSRQGVRIL